MTTLQEAPVRGGFDRLLRAAVGWVAGTVVGLLLAELLFTVLAYWWPLPRTWSFYASCATGVLGAVCGASQHRGPWLVQSEVRRRRRQHRWEHGWVDLVFRGGIGIVSGALCGLLAAAAVLIWWLTLAAPQAPLDEFEAFAWFLLSFFVGAGAGLLWFLADLPWLPGRRRTRRSAASELTE